MDRIAARLLYWPPRFLGIAYAIFLSVFALDVFGETRGFWNTMLALSIHLISTGMIVAVLIAAWRWEWMGAVLFAAAAGLYAWSVLPRHVSWAAIMGIPLVVIAALFLANWIERAKVRAAL